MEEFQLIDMLEDHTAGFSDTARTHGTPTQSFPHVPVSCEKSPSNNENKDQGRAVKLSFDPGTKAATLTPRRRRYKVPATDNSPSSTQDEVMPSFKLPLRPTTLPRTRHPSRTSLPVWEAGKVSNPRPNRQPPDAASAGPNTASSKLLRSNHAGTDFSPSNHHPDLASCLPKEPTQVPGEPSNETIAVRAGCDTYILLTPPSSPEIIAGLYVDDATFSDTSLSPGDDTSIDANQYKTIIEQQYNDHQGFFWNSAAHLLEEHYLHPEYLTKSEFISLVCGTTADTSSWLRDNLPEIKHRASKRWMNANYALRNAGISPWEIDAEFMEAFEFMDDEEQRIFIQSYQRLERHVANAEEDLRLGRQEREHYASLSLPGKHDFIKKHKFSAQLEADMGAEETRAAKRRPRVESLKARKAEKLQVLKEKLDEMKQIEQSIRDLENGSSRSSSSLGSHYSESSGENSPSSNGSEYHENVDQRNPIFQNHLSFGLGAEADDPFVDPVGLPTKGTLFHQYAIPEPRTSQQPLITTPNPLNSLKPERTNKMPYYDGVEYQGYVDDSWLCFENIPPNPNPLTESNLASRLIVNNGPTITTSHAEESSGGSERELSYEGASTKINEIQNDEFPIIEDGNKAKAEERASVMAKLTRLAKLLHVDTSYTARTKFSGENSSQEEGAQTKISIEDVAVDSSIEKLQHSQGPTTKDSMLSITSESSPTSTIDHKPTTKKVVSATRNLDHDFPKSFHVEFLEPVLKRSATNGGDSGEKSTSAKPTRRSIRKKMSKLFGSLRRKERATH
ncbi:hypothetical protein BJ875DRAFT_487406 [Amylocarpus encephaloides]|uniref:Uncharacterized protein n=1 Tax=Amylocarpus encephaloides TaxID=45428 RepID=A0A9P7YC84_9HELO|nr:hypothetical protein BJ875DRAFT_487406 [Amylocarpus encephaloides]